MTERLEQLILSIPRSKSFADIGCDHGLVSKGVLDRKIAQTVVIADVSRKCLQKAEQLLSSYIEQDKVKSYVADGFDNLPLTDTALIAGMGGEEIIKIMEKAESLPFNLVLQPMKNVDKVRERAVSLGYKIMTDKVYFLDGKFYDIIVLEKGQDSLTKDEIIFGRTNIKDRSKEFLARLNIQKTTLTTLLKLELSTADRQEKNKLLKAIEKYV